MYNWALTTEQASKVEEWTQKSLAASVQQLRSLEDEKEATGTKRKSSGVCASSESGVALSLARHSVASSAASASTPAKKREGELNAKMLRMFG